MTDQITPHVPSTDSLSEIKIVKREASLLQFLRDPLAFFQSINRHDGSVTEISLGGRRFYILSDPAVIRDILSTRGSLFEKFPQENPKQRLFGRGLLTSEGRAQKLQRRMLLPCFHRDRLQAYAHQMVACVDRLTATWHNGSIDITRAMNDLTLEIIGRTLLGVNDKPLMDEIGLHLHTMLNLANRFVVPWGDWLMALPLPSSRRYHRAVARLNAIIASLIQRARENLTSDTLIGILLQSRHPDGTELSDTEIRDEIVTMIVAGHETVAVGLTWTLYLLSAHPTFQADMASQVNQLLGARNPSVEDYPRLDFLQHTFSEALRLHPPIWILGRRTLEPYTFRNLNADKGTVFLVCIADLHRRAALFSDPDLFKPQRWTNPDWPTHAYIPFGGGDRRCIGEHFAWMEAVFVLACLLKQWKFALTDNQPPQSEAKLTLHPKLPLTLNVTAKAER